MKLYVFYFSRVTKEVVRDEVEVEDKPKSYKTPTFQRMATLKRR